MHAKIVTRKAHMCITHKLVLASARMRLARISINVVTQFMALLVAGESARERGAPAWCSWDACLSDVRRQGVESAHERPIDEVKVVKQNRIHQWHNKKELRT